MSSKSFKWTRACPFYFFKCFLLFFPFSKSEDGNGEHIGVSEANEAPGHQPIQKRVSFSHVYMEMRPVNNPSKSSSSFSASINNGEHHTSHAPRTNIVETCEGSQKDQAYVKSANAFHIKQVETRSQCLDSVCTTYI